MNFSTTNEFGRMRNPVFADAERVYTEAFAAIVDQTDNDFIVAELDGRIVGCYQLTFIKGLSHSGGLRAQIESVRIASDVRGGGLGSDLMRDGLARATERRCFLVQPVLPMEPGLSHELPLADLKVGTQKS